MEAKAEELVEVCITAKATIEFAQTRKIPVSALALYDEMCKADARDSEFSEAFERFIDPNDICDWGEIEDLEITKTTPTHGASER